MELFYVACFFILGLLIGSFLNTIIFRFPKKNFLKGRSKCPFCHHPLGIFDLIPLFSFLFLRGRCRYCQKKISFQYPLVEGLCGLCFALMAAKFLFPFNLANFFYTSFLILITSFLILIAFYDLKTMLIPNQFVYPALFIALAWPIANYFLKQPLSPDLLSSLKGSLVPIVGFGLLIFLTQGKGMGQADIKLGAVVGLLLGFPQILVALFLAFTSGALVGTFLIILGKKTLKSPLPFAPFLSLATLITLFWGQNLLEWYLGILGF